MNSLANGEIEAHVILTLAVMWLLGLLFIAEPLALCRFKMMKRRRSRSGKMHRSGVWDIFISSFRAISI